MRLELFSKPSNEYAEEQREFALTLHLYGPKAYSFLRDQIKIPLSHPHTLQK
jgi:hypothetical protein